MLEVFLIRSDFPKSADTGVDRKVDENLSLIF